MKLELKLHTGNIRIEVGDTADPNFYSFELHDNGHIVGGPFCEVTELTIAAVRERLQALLDPVKTC